MLFEHQDLMFCLFSVCSVDKDRVVLKSSTDYRPAALGYINASFISVQIYLCFMCVCVFDSTVESIRIVFVPCGMPNMILVKI